MDQGTYNKGFRSLLAWKESHCLTLLVYEVTQAFPRDERYGITSQMRRAASSIGAQLAEGSRMPTAAHRKLYYDRAYSSAAELDNFLELARDLKYLSQEHYAACMKLVNQVSFLIMKLSKSTITHSLPAVPSLPAIPSSVLH